MTQPTDPATTDSNTAENKTACSTTDRTTFVGEIQDKLNKIESKMTSMKDEGSRLAGDLKRKADDNLTKLDTKYQELKGKLEALKNSTAENWQADKAVFHKSIQELSTQFKGLFS